MNGKSRIIGFVVVVVMLMFAIPASAQATILIDGFSDPSFVSLQPASGNSLSQLDTGLSGVIGGSREITVNNDMGAVHGALFPDTFNLSTDVMSFGSFSMLYNNNGAGLGVDLSLNESIDILFRPDHLGLDRPSILSFTLTDASRNMFTSTKTWTTPIWPNLPTGAYMEEKFLLNDFTGVNLANVDSIEFFYQGDRSNDASFKSISTDVVPEPTSLFLFGTGLLGAFFKRKFKY